VKSGPQARSAAAGLASWATLLALGCGGGGSGHAGGPAPTGRPSTPGPGTSAPTAAPSGPAGPHGQTAPPADSAATGSPASPSDGGGALAVHIPAAFRVAAGRAIPATVSFPAHLAVELELRSADGRPHRAELRAPGGAPLAVPARGQAVQRIPGLRPGRYVLTVDGVPSGALQAGGEPGP